MYCLKCGKQIPESQVFCDECLKDMADYPIKPDTPVQLPKRAPQEAEKKAPRKKELSPEQVLQQYKSTGRWLILTIVVLTAIVCLLGGLLFEAYGGNLGLPQLF